MNRENVLFAVVGLLLGYVVAFHLVVYVNQGRPAAGAAGVEGPAAGAAALPTNEVKDRRGLQSVAAQAADAAGENKDSFEAQTAAADALLDVGEWSKALEFLARANELKPEDHGVLVRLGHANSKSGKYDEAEKWFRAALAKKPEDNNARSELALTYYLRTPKRPDKAIEELTLGLQANPTHLATLHNLSLMYIETGKVAEAESTIGKLEKADPSYPQLTRLREALREAGRKNAPSS